MKYPQSLVVALVVCALGLNGCESMKEHGAAFGAVFGAAAGAAVCKGNDRLRCAGAGALLGGVAGHFLAKYLTEKDQQERQVALQKALDEKKSTSWHNAQSGNGGSIQVSAAPTRTASKPVKVLKDKLTEPPALDSADSPQQITTSVNVRGGPGTDYKVVGGFAGGAKVEVLGKVKGSDWYLVGHQDVGEGYVYGKFLKPVPAQQVAAQEAPQPAIPASAVQEANVPVSMQCMTVNESISLANGKQGTEQRVLCKGPDGWQQV